MLVKRT